MNRKKKIVSEVVKHAWTLFLSGLFTILPFILTISLFTIVVRFIMSWLTPIRAYLNPTILGIMPHAELIIVLIFIFLVGFIYNMVILRPIIHLIEDAFLNLPLIKPIYTGIKQLVHAFSLQDKITFRQVVIVQFPRNGVYSIGFLTSELPSEITPQTEKSFFIVYIPTTPNPTSGYCVIVPKEDIHHIDLTRQEAMALIISGGIIRPERFNTKEKE